MEFCLICSFTSCMVHSTVDSGKCWICVGRSGGKLNEACVVLGRFGYLSKERVLQTSAELVHQIFILPFHPMHLHHHIVLFLLHVHQALEEKVLYRLWVLRTASGRLLWFGGGLHWDVSTFLWVLLLVPLFRVAALCCGFLWCWCWSVCVRDRWSGGIRAAGGGRLCSRELSEMSSMFSSLLPRVDPGVLHCCQEEAELRLSTRNPLMKHLKMRSLMFVLHLY